MLCMLIPLFLTWTFFLFAFSGVPTIPARLYIRLCGICTPFFLPFLSYLLIVFSVAAFSRRLLDMRDTTALPSPLEDEELPYLWQKPAYDMLFACLKRLHVKPRVWTAHVSRADILKEQAATAQTRRETVSFLSTIIKSSLAWLDSDDERELIWEEASKRMSERCGRTGMTTTESKGAESKGVGLTTAIAMGEITRRWPFELRDHDAFSLAIREPPLTGDSLGLKTWGSSYALAQLLHEFAAGPLAHLFIPGAISTPEEVLELGSGTGLLGLAAACIWKTSVVLTDLPAIISNLAHNADLNSEIVGARGGRVEVAPLTWGGGHKETDERFWLLNRYQVRDGECSRKTLRQLLTDP